jgi:hypothetical protein
MARRYPLNIFGIVHACKEPCSKRSANQCETVAFMVLDFVFIVLPVICLLTYLLAISDRYLPLAEASQAVAKYSPALPVG